MDQKRGDRNVNVGGEYNAATAATAEAVTRGPKRRETPFERTLGDLNPTQLEKLAKTILEKYNPSAGGKK